MMKSIETSFEERVEVLATTLALNSLEKSNLEALASRMVDRSYQSGQVVITQGEDADGLFLIVKGRAQVSELDEGIEVLLATLEEGELFGEIAFFADEQKRTSTVTAITELKLLFLEATAFTDLLATHSGLLHSMKELTENRIKLNFLKKFSPFKSLRAEKIKTLFSNLEKMSVDSGTTVIKQGHTAQECYLIISGRMEVLVSDNKKPVRKIATLYPGSIVGEAALLTNEPRNATVHAVENCELLVIKRNILLEIMSEDTQLENHLMTLLQRRSRPKRTENVIVQKQKTQDGDTIWILKNPEIGAYVRLSSEGWFIWERLDGEHTLKDLTLEFMSEKKVLAPARISGIVSELAKSGLLLDKTLRADVMALTRKASWQQRTLKAARHVVEFNLVWNGADPFFSFLYRFTKFLYSRTIQIILGLFSFGGVAIFFTFSNNVTPFLNDASQSRPVLIFLLPAILVSLVIHEIGHGITTKHFRREVRSAGIGWYWFSPIAFVNTTDMWTADKWPRVAVSIAGPYCNFILAGIASYIAWISSSPFMSAALWQFALVSYIVVLMNLHPLLEYDGYFILSDLLSRPNLRRRSLEWFGGLVRGDADKRLELHRHRFDFIYGISSIIYVAIMAYFFVISYRIVMEVHLRSLLPNMIASIVPWLIVALIVISAGVTLVGDMRIFQRRLR